MIVRYKGKEDTREKIMDVQSIIVDQEAGTVSLSCYERETARTVLVPLIPGIEDPAAETENPLGAPEEDEDNGRRRRRS